ncbi:MAG: hypothetical protein AVDCRST_MAG14-1678, partial [uncultured Rubrobacteraceae bacterium]
DARGERPLDRRAYHEALAGDGHAGPQRGSVGQGGDEPEGLPGRQERGLPGSRGRSGLHGASGADRRGDTSAGARHPLLALGRDSGVRDRRHRRDPGRQGRQHAQARRPDPAGDGRNLTGGQGMAEGPDEL